MQDWLGGVFADRGVDRVAAEELAVPPGGDELFSLLQLKRHFEAGEWDAIIVDCAPTGETLRLLSFPEVARWWLDRVLGRERALLAAARPLARAFLDLSLPDERAFAEVQRLVRNLVAMNEILRDRGAVSLRLVMTPDRMVVAEAMRTFTYLNLYGYLTDAVVVNRVFPRGGRHYFGAWRALQAASSSRWWRPASPPCPSCGRRSSSRRCSAPRCSTGSAGACSATATRPRSCTTVSQELTLGRRGAELRLELPFAAQGRRVAQEDRARADRARRRPEAHDHAAAALAPLRPASASFEDGALVVRFAGE